MLLTIAVTVDVADFLKALCISVLVLFLAIIENSTLDYPNWFAYVCTVLFTGICLCQCSYFCSFQTGMIQSCEKTSSGLCVALMYDT